MDDAPPRLTLSANAAAWKQIEGETVLLDLRSSEYLGVNQSGSILWSALAEGTTEPRLVTLLAEQFDLSTAQASLDVHVFLKLCEEHGLIQVDERSMKNDR